MITVSSARSRTVWHSGSYLATWKVQHHFCFWDTTSFIYDATSPANPRKYPHLM